MSEKKIAAFFDFDQTLLAKESAALGFRWAWENRRVSLAFLLKIIAASKLYKINLLSAEAISTMSMQYYKGQNLSEYRQGAPGYYQEWLKPHLSPSMLTEVERHRSQGHKLVLLSASLDYLLRTVTDDLRFDHLLASKVEVDENDIGTGRTEGPMMIGPQKKVAALELAEKEDIDLAQSYAYTDHHSDLPLLESVGHPVAVRPTKQLRRIARERAWPIVDKG